MRRVSAAGVLPLAAAAALAAATASFPLAVQDPPPAPHARPAAAPAPEPAAIRAGERHFRNLRQLTFGGQNAEGYWSPDGRQIVYQRMDEKQGLPCDQLFVLDVASGRSRRVSDGRGRVTCGYFLFLDGRQLLYSTTALSDPGCPPAVDHSQGYAWPMHPGYDIVVQAVDGSALRRLTATPGYDAEATVSPDGRTIVFTSVRDGDLEIYTMAADGTNVKRLTREPGYDGGPFFSPDGGRIVYRRDVHPDAPSLARYRELLSRDLYRPGVLEIWVMDSDGGNKRQVTRLGAASFAPYFHPDGRRILFASNHPEPRGRNFDLWLVGEDGSGLERVTTESSFDGFPMFSPDGSRLVFASNRGGSSPGETNLFVVDWVD